MESMEETIARNMLYAGNSTSFVEHMNLEAERQWQRQRAMHEDWLRDELDAELSKTPKPMPNMYRRLLGALYSSTNLTPVYA